VLRDNAEKLGYPQDDFEMAMQIHLAPRLMQLRKAISKVIKVDVGILAGSLHSVPMAKAYLAPSLDAVETYKDNAGELAESLETGIHVDDVVQTNRNYVGQVSVHLAEAADVFGKHVTGKAKMRLSPKSRIVSSNGMIASSVFRILRDRGYHLKVAKVEKILGVDVAGGAKRVLGTQARRLGKAKIRNKAVKYLVSKHRFARKLFTTGTLPQAT
jgi:hypothetical protein